MRRTILHIATILAWADAHHARTGQWPRRASGKVLDAINETWSNVDSALRHGSRGLRPGSSLIRLLAERRGARNRKALPRLTPALILEWCDAYRAWFGRWPSADSGPIPRTNGDTWMGIEMALSHGQRGLPGGMTLARLLSLNRGVRNTHALPPLRIDTILEWADAHHEATGRWPMVGSGPIAGSGGENWTAIDVALKQGLRGLKGGDTLARLLERCRGVRNRLHRPPLTFRQIHQWADAHFARTGRWPTARSGPIPQAPGETWSGIAGALEDGRRGLRRWSLARLLEELRNSNSR